LKIIKVLLAFSVSLAVMAVLVTPILDIVDGDNGILISAFSWLTLSLGSFIYSLLIKDDPWGFNGEKKRDAKSFSIFSAILGSVLLVLGLYTGLT
jgi:archaellum biogenesis protein FlaJ (TadC family)